jgi:hypothetical protein
METLANDPAVFDHHRSNHGIRAGPSRGPGRQSKGVFHKQAILIDFIQQKAVLPDRSDI